MDTTGMDTAEIRLDPTEVRPVLSSWLMLPPAEIVEALRQLTALGRGQRPSVEQAVTVAAETVSGLWLDRR